MDIFFELVKLTLNMLVSALLIAMTARAVLSWFPIGDNKLTGFLYVLTEPIIIPIRLLFKKMNWFADFPLDMAFYFTTLILVLLNVFLKL